MNSCLNMREVVNPLGSFGTDIVAEALADGSDSALCLAIGLVMVSSSHVEINLDVGHKVHPKG